MGEKDSQSKWAQLLHTATSRFARNQGDRRLRETGSWCLCQAQSPFFSSVTMTYAELSIVSVRQPAVVRPHLLKTSISSISPRRAVQIKLCFRIRSAIILNQHHSENKGTTNSLFQRKIPGRILEDNNPIE